MIDMIAIPPNQYDAQRRWAARGVRQLFNDAYMNRDYTGMMNAISEAEDAGLNDLARELRSDLNVEARNG